MKSNHDTGRTEVRTAPNLEARICTLSIAPSALWVADTPPSSRDGAKRYLLETLRGIELSSCEVHPHYQIRFSTPYPSCPFYFQLLRPFDLQCRHSKQTVRKQDSGTSRTWTGDRRVMSPLLSPTELRSLASHLFLRISPLALVICYHNPF